MEVHAHTHTPRKKWTHYFWEFLMLFLAVFCGFLAENKREHMIEHRREIQYMRSLREDLSKDISQIEKNQPLLRQLIGRLDSIAIDFSDLKNGTPAFSTIKYLNKGLPFPDFIYNDRTIQQLKNAGNMRLVRNEKVAERISTYDGWVRAGLVSQEMTNNLFLPKMLDKINYTINTTLMKKLVTGDLSETEAYALRQQILLTHDKNELIRFVNEVNTFRFSLFIIDGFFTHYKESAKQLITLINKEYHLK